ncbi:hypothetical protein L3Y34_006413 [Caenorhabditis briggsae]|uniref:Glycosyltransferase family 92 protein n=1 Tax=Caenorhabditis briggsae TaxID=6238 RepID=A0AAE9CYV0_CAEBR|nr:hypothetical protein L3Y34_006413 [Caenorhabditis briggsae]
MNNYFQLGLIIIGSFLFFDVFLNDGSISSRVQYSHLPLPSGNTVLVDLSSEIVNQTTEKANAVEGYEIEGEDRFKWYLKRTASNVIATAPNITTLYAYEFDHEITVTTPSWKMIRRRVYCRYLDKNGNEIGTPYESFTYPEYIVNCPKRKGTQKIGLSVTQNGEFVPLPLVDRMLKKPKYELSMCVATIYGEEPKWLLFIEMVEHFKLQGVQHFYLHIHHASNYDLKMINDYVRTGEVEIHYLLERDKRTDNHWHMVNIADCLIWSRGESKWTIFADLDERILMTEYPGTILDYMREIRNESIGGVQFRQQWVLKTELMPEKYESGSQDCLIWSRGKSKWTIFADLDGRILMTEYPGTILDYMREIRNESTIDAWMPTHRFHNSTGIGPIGHTATNIIDTS